MLDFRNPVLRNADTLMSRLTNIYRFKINMELMIAEMDIRGAKMYI